MPGTTCIGASGGYAWQTCEDFQVPDNSVWYGRDDDGSDIFCGKAWCDGQEVPAKIIPNKRECRVIDNGCERDVPNCRKVLICSRSDDNNCYRSRDHCRRPRPQQCFDSSSCSESDEETTTATKKSTCSNNASKVHEKSVKSCSNSSTTIVKRSSKVPTRHRRQGQCCWYERRTRMVPKEVVRQRVRYIPQVTNERSVHYVQESYVIKVCGRARCAEGCEPSCAPCEPHRRSDPCEPCEPCEPCGPCGPYDPCGPCDPCMSNRRNRTVLFSE